MQIGKLLGIDFKEQENEVLEKLMELEEKDMERVVTVKRPAKQL